MPSPFPGMDPYLENHWGDVHASIVTYARDLLNKALPRDLRARIEERVFVEAPAERRAVIPDVRVFERHRRGAKAAASTVAMAEPLIVTLADPLTEGYIEIREATAGHKVITVLEVLSPANKAAGEARAQYLRKQQELADGQVSLVEIDLLRAGRRTLPFPVERLPASCRTPYYACVRRAWEPTQVEVYALSLRTKLPAIRIPLRPTDADAPLDLQQLIDQCYENGAYGDDLDYRRAPDPPLAAADARWASSLLRRQGKRGRK